MTNGHGSVLKDSFDVISLYGRNTGFSDKSSECRIYELNNETGAGMITVYNVFSGIRAVFNDIHMSYCSKDQSGSRNVIEINHCMEGRYECSVGEKLCCYMSHGDVAVKASGVGSENSCFPTGHYHGISIFIETDGLSDELLAVMKMLSIDIDRVKALTSNENSLFMLRKNDAASHIFSELYDVRENHRAGLLKLKILELLLFLTDIIDMPKSDTSDSLLDKDSVELAKLIRDLIVSDIKKHYTIDELSDIFGISPTALKKKFAAVYGTSVYAYLKKYRLQEAQKELLRTDFSVTDTACGVGYESPAKFSAAFKSECGMTPTQFRKNSRARIESAECLFG